jgi:WD40 repeat protein
MGVDEGLEIVEQILKRRLNTVQKLIIQYSWNGQSYKDITTDFDYDLGYIKDTGSKLWQSLSSVLGEKVTKQNVTILLKRFWEEARTPKNSDRKRSPVQYDWGDAIDVSLFHNRINELATLEQWITGYSVTSEQPELRCRLISILGMGGVGKTALSIKLAERVQHDFEYLIWRSLRNAPPLQHLLADLLQVLAHSQAINSTMAVEDQLSLLMSCLRQHRCLFILDNVEPILQAGQYAGQYSEGYQDYGELFYRVGQSSHQSCLVLTSREKPRDIAQMEGKTLPVRTWQLAGLDVAAGRTIFSAYGDFQASDYDWNFLVNHYAGNPLALRMVAAGVQDILSGDLHRFIDGYLKTGQVTFTDIQDSLTRQFDRLSPSEQEIMYWLAIDREPVSDVELLEEMISPLSQGELLDALISLRRRSLIEKTATGFTQQPVIMEYVTERFVRQICDDLLRESESEWSQLSRSPIALEPSALFIRHALIKAQTKDYIRDVQIRLILQPLAKRLLSIADRHSVEHRLSKLIATLRQRSPAEHGYAGGNLLNLLWQLQVELKGYDFSHLFIRQAYVPHVSLLHTNFSHASISQSVFADTFGGVLSVAFSADGVLLAISDTEGQIRIWNTSTRQQTHAFNAHAIWAWGIAFHPDGTCLASASDDYCVKLWDLQTGTLLKVLQGHTYSVNAVAFSPDGQYLASSSQDATIRLWRTDTASLFLSPGESGDELKYESNHELNCDPLGESDDCIHVLKGHTHRVWSIAFSPDGQILASVAEDKTAKLWDVKTGKCLYTLYGHTDWARCVAFHPIATSSPMGAGYLLATGSMDETIKLWDLQTRQCVMTLRGHTKAVTAVAFSPDGQWLVSSSNDETIKLWEIATGRCLKTLHDHNNRVWSIAYSPDGRWLASGGDDHAAKLWEISPTSTASGVNPTENGSLRRRSDWVSVQCVKTWKGHTNAVLSLAQSPDGQWLASGHTDETVKLWDLKTGQVFKTLHGHRDRVWSVAFVPSQNPNRHEPTDVILASGSADRTIKLWNCRTGQCLNTLQGHTSWVWSIAPHPAGEILASSSYDHIVKLWDLQTGQCLNTLMGHTSPVVSVAFSPDGQRLISSDFNQTIRLWDLQTGDCLQIIRGHGNSIWQVAFSPDGQQFASCSYDQTIKLWDSSTGCCLQTLSGHTAPAISVQFSPDGRSLVSSSFDRTVKHWDIETGTCLQTLQGHHNVISALKFDRTEAAQPILFSGSFDETIKRWDLNTGTCLDTWHVPRPYEGMTITGITGLTDAEQSTLTALGAIGGVEDERERLKAKPGLN